MSTDTTTATAGATESMTTWQRGVVAGVAGGLAMGVMLTVQMTPVIEVAIPAMYGLTGGLAGWVMHMAHSAVLGVAFAAAASAAPSLAADQRRTVGAGLAYGAVLWAVLAVLVMPVWLGAVGFPGAPPFPNVSVMSLVGHLVYGAVLGVAYALLE
jgi:uncharacterized membrane protein YagU involved in acid resistance